MLATTQSPEANAANVSHANTRATHNMTFVDVASAPKRADSARARAPGLVPRPRGSRLTHAHFVYRLANQFAYMMKMDAEKNANTHPIPWYPSENNVTVSMIPNPSKTRAGPCPRRWNRYVTSPSFLRRAPRRIK